MGENGTERAAEDAESPPFVSDDGQIIGHFEVGPAGVGPMVDVTTGEFFPVISDAASTSRGSS
jgi:hypothetical protein